MFDRTYVQAGPSSLDVRVTEKRASTDESVRLLREMEAKAREQVVEAMRLTSASVEAVVHRYNDPMDLKTHFKIHYKLNGKSREVVLWTEDDAKIVDKLEAIWKRVAEDIAEVLVQGIVRTVGGRASDDISLPEE